MTNVQTADFVADIDNSGVMPLHERELKSSDSPTFDFTLSASMSDGGKRIDTTLIDLRTSFEQNLRYWNDQTRFMAANNTQNSYFKAIVDMGKAAVPFIVEELKKKPSFLVYALDEIFPGVMEYEGYVSTEKACEVWLSTLREIGIA